MTLNNLYELLMEKLEVSLAIIKGFMTGSVRHYLLYILTFIILVMGAAMLLFEGMSFDPSRDAVVSFYELALLLGMIATAVTVLWPGQG